MIEKIIKDLIDKLLFEIKNEENQKKIEIELLNPILSRYTNKIYPYFTLLLFLYCINLILIIIILILIIMFNREKIKF
jgi:hypothetical protein